MSNPIQEDEERRLVREILDQQKKWILGTGSTAHYAFTEDLLVNAFKAHSEQTSLEAELKEAINQLKWFRENIGKDTIMKDITFLIEDYSKQLAQLTNNNTEVNDATS